jgi:hypothetical protein
MAFEVENDQVVLPTPTQGQLDAVYAQVAALYPAAVAKGEKGVHIGQLRPFFSISRIELWNQLEALANTGRLVRQYKSGGVTLVYYAPAN